MSSNIKIKFELISRFLDNNFSSVSSFSGVIFASGRVRNHSSSFAVRCRIAKTCRPFQFLEDGDIYAIEIFGGLLLRSRLS